MATVHAILNMLSYCEGNSPVTSEFPIQGANNAEHVAILWRYHDLINTKCFDSNNAMSPLLQTYFSDAYGYIHQCNNLIYLMGLNRDLSVK